MIHKCKKTHKLNDDTFTTLNIPPTIRMYFNRINENRESCNLRYNLGRNLPPSLRVVSNLPSLLKSCQYQQSWPMTFTTISCLKITSQTCIKFHPYNPFISTCKIRCSEIENWWLSTVRSDTITIQFSLCHNTSAFVSTDANQHIKQTTRHFMS